MLVRANIPWMAAVLAFAQLSATVPARAVSLSETPNVKEFFTSNRDGRLLIRVLLWGDSPLSGVHYLPDNATITDLFGFAGGIPGDIEEAKINISRQPLVKRQGAPPLRIQITGRELLTETTYRSFHLQNGDIIHLLAEPKDSGSFLKSVTVFGTIVGVISASLALYLLVQRI